MQALPLTHAIGLAERSMRALLERELDEAGLSFPDWIVLVFTSAAPLDIEQVIQRQLDNHIVPDPTDVQRAIDRLVEAGLIVCKENVLVHTGRDRSAPWPTDCSLGTERSRERLPYKAVDPSSPSLIRPFGPPSPKERRG
ncbi:MarR family winged helix-turn-helix transcriptional regulator [Methylococcus sp. EFPC2]|uniref:MarR family winged helix-turn-helix transcriptional regulator n=1 Tax=Methylococcus sp. EFPC2 TaxID=2812648 RepID=UPI001966F9CA|nr:MarR family winged helix-turn-helix transcriptional regulator [Methylococcus sp. EFPC2]QSA97303.1 winged helix-turn-helix transcriptional regulator [Methylococcus sp. EFPC2]